MVGLEPARERGGGGQGGLIGAEVGLGGAAPAVSVEEGLGALLFGRGAGEEEEVIDEEVLLLGGVFEDDEDAAAGSALGRDPVGDVVSLGGWTPRGPGEKRRGQALEGRIGAKPADVGEAFVFEGVEQVGRGEAGVGTERDARDGSLQSTQDRQDEIEAAVGGVGAAGPEPAAEEEAVVDAGDEGMKAAGVVMAVVGGAGLVAMDHVGEEIEMQGGLLAARDEKGADHLANDTGEPGFVLLAGQDLEEARERGLRVEFVGGRPRGGAKRTAALSCRDGEAQGGVMAKQRDVVLIGPTVDEIAHPGAQQKLDEGRLVWCGLRGSSRCLPAKADSQSRSVRSRIRSAPASAFRRSSRASATPEWLKSGENSVPRTSPMSCLRPPAMQVWSRQPHLVAAQVDTPWAICAPTVPRLASPSIWWGIVTARTPESDSQYLMDVFVG